MRLIDADAFDKVLQDAQAECKKNGGNFRYGVLSNVRGNLAIMPTVGGWISVKDRLPESGGEYLTYSPKGKMRVATAFLPSTIPNARYDARECWWSLPGNHFVAVTHWMPLPEPPKEVDE